MKFDTKAVFGVDIKIHGKRNGFTNVINNFLAVLWFVSKNSKVIFCTDLECRDNCLFTLLKKNPINIF